MTVVIVQCRLSSTRLPEKAMMMIGGAGEEKPLVWWTLRAMKCVSNHKGITKYVLATDAASIDTLRPVALECGYEIMSGPLEDVLERFCIVIRETKADTVVRATADNPFIFFEAAQSLLDEYNKRDNCDYITYTGLPHGSGVEVMNAKSLLRASSTSSLYDREHVGPALYNHKDKFNCVTLNAPLRFLHSELRTTVDTAADLRQARLIERVVRRARRSPSAMPQAACIEGGSGTRGAYTTEEIISALSSPSVKNKVLFVPSVHAGQGTGHLKRCVEAAAKIDGFVLIQEGENNLSQSIINNIINSTPSFEPWQAVGDMPEKGEYALIAADRFALTEKETKELSDAAMLLSIDDGGGSTELCDCLIDIIPSALDRKANITDAALMGMPHKVHRGERAKKASDFRKVLVCFGGEDPAHLTFRAAREVKAALSFDGAKETSIFAVTRETPPDGYGSGASGTGAYEGIKVMPPVPLLRETLFDYDLVITHYGLTAYEAVMAGCAVLLVATTPLHGKLSKKYGFACLDIKDLKDASVKDTSVRANKIAYYLNKPDLLYADISALLQSHKDVQGGEATLSSIVRKASMGKRIVCPVCGNTGDDRRGKIEGRAMLRTYRRCPICGMVYMSWTMDSEAEYSAQYFGEQYKKQYGKTYLEDFDSIKTQGARRIKEIDALWGRHGIIPSLSVNKGAYKGSVLDIGCAYGPFLSAAREDGWQVFGTDISEAAVAYVQSSLMFPACVAHFPDFSAAREFGTSCFDAVAMWYVIEHFKDIDSVLKAVSLLLKDGGIFAFSTPSGEGVSAKMQRDNFFETSPADHYTIWEPSRAASILKRYGFKVEKIISTGHHAERFPIVQKHGWSATSALYKAVGKASEVLRLGDTCEIYARKRGAGNRE